VPPSFTLKIAASVLFCAVASSVRFVDFYTGGLSYVDVMAESLQDMASLCSSFVGLWQLRTLSFTWPSFDLPSVGLSFTMSVELAAVSFLLEYFVSMYFRLVHTDEEGRKVLFSMEEVTVKKRARDVRNFEYGEPEGETGRCRLKKGQVAYFCARIIDNVAMGSATIISAAMAKIMHEQNKKQVYHRMNFQYVTDEVCCQFAFDNPRVRTVDLTGCINVTTRTLAAIGSTLATTVTAKSCKLAGPIPSFAANTALQKLYLTSNRLTGTIQNFSKNLALETLSLWQNQLTGELPLSLIEKKARGCEVSFYENTGFTLPEMENLGNDITHLDLSRCSLTGAIPDFSTCTALQKLYLFENKLTGKIPDFSKNQALELLSLSVNKLTGKCDYDHQRSYLTCCVRKNS